jgi:hypothetical protein
MLTAEQLAAAFNAAGLDTEAKLKALLVNAGLSLQRVSLQTAIEVERKAQISDSQAHEAKVQALNQQILEVEAALAAAVAP